MAGLLDPSEFELSSFGAQRIEEVQADPAFVDNEISDSILGTEAPFPFTLLYRKGQRLDIPLSNVFSERLSSAITTMRKHISTGRIVPFQASQDDPALRDPSLSGLPSEEAFSRILKPRFDPTLTPNIVSLVNQAQSIFLAKGLLKIILWRLGPPLAKGAAATAGDALASTVTTQTVLSKMGTVTVESTLARNIINPAGKLAAVIKGIQPRFVVSVPRSLSQAFTIVSDAAGAAGLEPGIVVRGNFLGESLVIQNVGNVTTTILKS